MRSAIEVRLQPGAFILHPSSFSLSTWICLDLLGSAHRRPIQSALPRQLQGRRRGVHSLRFTQRSIQKLLVLVGSGWICLDLLGFNAPASNPVGTAPTAPGAPPRGAFIPIHPALQPKAARFGRIRLDLLGFAWIQRSSVQSSWHCPGGSSGAAAGCIHSDSRSASSQKLLVLVGSGRILPGFAWIDIPAPMQQSALPRQGIHPFTP